MTIIIILHCRTLQGQIFRQNRSSIWNSFSVRVGGDFKKEEKTREKYSHDSVSFRQLALYLTLLRMYKQHSLINVKYVQYEYNDSCGPSGKIFRAIHSAF